MPRFSDFAELETVLLDRKDIPSVGAGECPMIGVAPAIANAIFDATGVRLRALPLVSERIESQLRSRSNPLDAGIDVGVQCLSIAIFSVYFFDSGATHE